MEKVVKGLGINFKSSKEYEPCKEVMPSRKLNYNVVCKTKCNVKQKKNNLLSSLLFSCPGDLQRKLIMFDCSPDIIAAIIATLCKVFPSVMTTILT